MIGFYRTSISLFSTAILSICLLVNPAQNLVAESFEQELNLAAIADPMLVTGSGTGTTTTSGFDPDCHTGSYTLTDSDTRSNPKLADAGKRSGDTVTTCVPDPSCMEKHNTNTGSLTYNFVFKETQSSGTIVTYVCSICEKGLLSCSCK